MRYFTSDHHFYHTNVIKYCNRPFKDVDHMNWEMVRLWNETVQPEDEVYYLGDFSLAHRAVTLFLPKLNGTKHLIAGNHDICHPAVHKNKEIKARNSLVIYSFAGFRTIKLQDTIEIAGHKVLMCHMPYSGDHKEERYKEYRPVDEGNWLLHGHVHEAWLLKNKQINVGVDVWNFRPVSELQIAELIKNAK